MKIKSLIGLLLAVVLFAPIACTSPTVSPAPTSTSDQTVAGQEFVKKILDSLQGSSGWTPPLPPTGGQKPRTLTQAEKNKVLEMAGEVPIVVEVKQNKDVVSVDTSYLWVGWNGNADGESFLNYEAVENGTANLSNKDDTWYPAADFLFHSRFGEYGKVGIQVAVNLETGKVVWLGGYIQFPIPPKLPPTSSPSPILSPSPIEFTKITAPLTLNGEKPGTDIPFGSIVYHWANGITEVYGADNNRIFIAKDSEAAMLPHPSGPNGPYESPATFIYQVPNGTRIDNGGDSKVTKMYLGDTLILTVIKKSENFPNTP